MARIDDVAQGFIKVLKQTYPSMPEETSTLIEGAVRYGFEHGASFGKYEYYAEGVQKEIAREVFQENKPKTKKIQKVVRTEKGYKPTELDSYLNDGWSVAHITPMADGRLEYIIETENLGNSEAVKKPEE